MTHEPNARFAYEEAFSRNLGLVQPQEQDILRRSTIAIAGMGGVGGVHLTTLARMGIGNFKIADFDRFEVHNFNRQAGAFNSTLDERKTDVMRRLTLDINPTVNIESYDEGITENNVERFLSGVDVAVDGLDYFAMDAREYFYKFAYSHGIPIVSAGPIGCSAALLVFLPGGMTWKDYFAIDLAESDSDKYLLFLLGTAPRATQFKYIDRTYVNFAQKRGPSLALSVQLCAGVVAAEAMKLLLKRGPIYSAPYYQQFDAYLCKHVVGKLRWGNRGPLQRLKFQLAKRWLLSTASTTHNVSI